MSANSAIYNPSQTTSAATGDGFSVPRLTTTGRLAITFTTADKGMMVYDTTLNNLFIWNGTAWESVPASGDSVDTEVIFNDNGELRGDPGLTYQKTVQRLTVGGTVDIWEGLNQNGTSTGVGLTALNATIAGATGNTAIGYRSMYRATTASDNTAVGANTLSANFFSGTSNVAVGTAALASNTANDNVAVGASALTANTTGTQNTAVGRAAMETNLVGANCTAFGNKALNKCAVNNNTAVGNVSSQNLISGSENTSLGAGSLFTCTAGIRNVAIGYNSNVFGTGGYNVAIGAEAAAGATFSGSYNVIIGDGAGVLITTGQSNIVLGVGAQTSSATASNQLSIGNATYYVATNGAAATYFPNAVTGTVLPPAGSSGFIRFILNGSVVKVAVYTD